jgi:adenylate kinase family enzyme
MLFIFMGPSCSGKSTLADLLKKEKGMQIYTGKDYLSFAKNENEAWKILMDKLAAASNNKELSGGSAVYIITEKNIVSKLPSFRNAVQVKFTADLDIIKDRFTKRMRGNLPQPVEKMLERQVKDWEDISSDICIDTTGTQGQGLSPTDLTASAERIIEMALSKYLM